MNLLYFSHNKYFRADTKGKRLFNKFGHFGYGVYWCIEETFSIDQNYRLKLSELDLLSADIGVEEDYLKNFIEFGTKIGLYEKDEYYFWSTELVKTLDKMKDISEKRRNAAKKRVENKQQSNVFSIDDSSKKDLSQKTLI